MRTYFGKCLNKVRSAEMLILKKNHSFSVFWPPSHYVTSSMLRSKNCFFAKWEVIFSSWSFSFVLAWKSSLMRSFCWSGKFHRTSELGKRSKTVLKTAIPTFLHGFLFLAQWTWTLCQLWLFETSLGPFSELRARMKLSGPGKWPHGRALSF